MENTQYALIATVYKLYAMVRNGESWELGEPGMNDKSQPVIHDIASKLGCIRDSPDLPYAFAEGEQDFVELQARIQNTPCESAAEEVGRYIKTEALSPAPSGSQRAERASSSESEHSNGTGDRHPINASPHEAADRDARRPCSSLDASYGVPSHMYTESPAFGASYAPWPYPDGLLGPGAALESTSSSYARPLARHADVEAFAHDGTIRPGMLECNSVYSTSAHQVDTDLSWAGVYENMHGMTY